MSRAAFLWDESYLWGVMAFRALKAAGFPFDLVRSEDVRRGILSGYRTLFVPGGWASNKMKALGEEGLVRIRAFVQGGGDYLGLCGGAGLATMEGIGLLPIGRRPTTDRVPSFSGRIRLRLTGHPAWAGIASATSRHNDDPGESEEGAGSGAVFHAWWPSQFVLLDSSVRPLATYGRALSDAFSSDLNVGDVESHGGWETLEQLYGINLDPGRLEGEPAVVEGAYGKGKVVLSLVHFDTPGDRNGWLVLRNLHAYLMGGDGKGLSGESVDPSRATHLSSLPLRGHRAVAVKASAEHRQCTVMSDLLESVTSLVSLGMRNFLWFWRNPLLLQWRRGIRGLEYCTLYILVREVADLIGTTTHANLETSGADLSDLERIRGMLLPFVEKSQRLLLLERYALQRGHITYEKCDDPEIASLRKELFASSKSYGGLFKELIAEVDALLFSLLQREEKILRGT
ncbi:MAG: BPL-N domain-containing protein [Chloroflexota bacterium]